MSNIEHYFENLLFHGVDNIHQDVLTEEEKVTVQTCVNYVLWDIFCGREDFLNFINQKNNYKYLS